jgi:hypothetical protein
MEMYITVGFYIGIIALVINLLSLLVVDYPKTKKETIGEKLFQIIVGGGFVVWAGFLLYT